LGARQALTIGVQSPDPMRRDKDSEYTIVEPKYSASYTLTPYGYGMQERPKYKLTSFVEIRDILAAVGVLTIAFYWVIYRSGGAGALHYLSLAAISVVAGFLIHEMSHKVVARRYGCWAEFRADYRMLGLALVTAFFGFLFAAPGAVMIAGNVNREQNGRISLAGPGSNLAVALACLPLTMISGIPATVSDIAGGLYFFSVFLAAFNMIPVLPFDGSKIWHWSKPIYIATLLAAGLLFALALAGL